VAEEIDLQMERPGAHIRVKVRQVRIIGHRLEIGAPAQPGTDPFRQRSFSGADIPGHNYESLRHDTSFQPQHASQQLYTRTGGCIHFPLAVY